jgi:hypothetical protein
MFTWEIYRHPAVEPIDGQSEKMGESQLLFFFVELVEQTKVKYGVFEEGVQGY